TDAGRLYFDSKDSLSPNDVNEGVEDAYSYDPQGQGTCTRPDGCTSLISSGHAATDSNFFAADATGANVFFTTYERLLPSDEDDVQDIYDARENGGIVEAAEAQACSGEACRPNSPGPIFAGVASSALTGLGNLAPPGPAAASRQPAPSRAQQLAKALKACHKLGRRKRRMACEAVARKKYGHTGSTNHRRKNKKHNGRRAG
ncbi:MAG TPA: hypothetical protein VMB05_01140, partial [Solirubrobacteraceae bacterium]|nr:hypothetical protein [Solirubrobacteraceae bacterium]